MQNFQTSSKMGRVGTTVLRCKSFNALGSPYKADKQTRKDVKRIVDHWRTKFDWRAHEAKLNSLPNYEVQVNVEKHGPVDMHFIHQKSDVKGAIPLLFVHGWPGSVLEVMLPLLKGGDGKPAFHVVAPSLPSVL
jgi:pimeloyl-ACP methyl ester carboxylesterase